MTSSLRRIEWNKILSSISLFYILVFWPHFCSEASHGQCCLYTRYPIVARRAWPTGRVRRASKGILHTTMLYVSTKNYPQVVGTCSGHHGQLISQNCVLTKIRAEPPPPPPLRVRLDFDHSVYSLIHFCFVNDLWECESKLIFYTLILK